MTIEDVIRKKYEALSSLMDERTRRCWAGIEAEMLGDGGIAMVERATGVDTKKTELVGAFKKAGREWQPMGEPVPVRVHDFKDPVLGKVIPYGVYDLGRNEGWVNVGVDHDTPEVAVASISRWWSQMGRRVYEAATELLITADAGGSNAYRSRVFKTECSSSRTELA